MQVRLPEEDEQESLHHSARSAEVRAEEKKGEESQGTPFKYLIIAGLAVVIILLLNSSHQKVRIIYSSPMEGKKVKGRGDVTPSKINTMKNNIDTAKNKDDYEQEKKKQVNQKPFSFSEEINE